MDSAPPPSLTPSPPPNQSWNNTSQLSDGVGLLGTSSSDQNNVVTAPALPHLKAVRYAHDAVNVDEPRSFPRSFHRVLKKLGAGSYGIVYLVEMDDPRPSVDNASAVSPPMPMLFAAKYIPLRNMDSRSLLRVVREVEMLTTFQFSSEIVETVRCFVDSNRPNREADHSVDPNSNQHNSTDAPALWIIMERFENSLFHHYPSSRYDLAPLTLPGFKHVIAQVFLGLSLMHSEMCCHRDLSPKNILVSSEQHHAALADFGLARFLNENHSYTTDGVVTILYRAPEVALGVRNYSTKVDVWSVGVLIAEFLLQRHLFEVERNDNQSLLYEIFVKVGFPTADDMAGPYSTVSFLAADYMGECQEEMDATPGRMPFQLAPTLANAVAYHHHDDPDGHLSVGLCLALLRLNPNERLTADEALSHPFFDSERSFVDSELAHHREMLQIARGGRPPGSLFSTVKGTPDELYRRLLEFAPLESE